MPPAFGAVARFAVTEEAKNTKEASIIIDTYKVDIKNRDDFSSLFFVLYIHLSSAKINSVPTHSDSAVCVF